MITENISEIKIHRLTQEQFDRELLAGNIKKNEIYVTPDNEILIAEAKAYTDTAKSQAVAEAKAYADEELLKARYVDNLSLCFNNDDYTFKVDLTDTKGNVISSNTIDLPLESSIVDATYNSGIITFTLRSGQKLSVPINDIISGLVTTKNLEAKSQELIKEAKEYMVSQMPYLNDADAEKVLAQEFGFSRVYIRRSPRDTNGDGVLEERGEYARSCLTEAPIPPPHPVSYQQDPGPYKRGEYGSGISLGSIPQRTPHADLRIPARRFDESDAIAGGNADDYCASIYGVKTWVQEKLGGDKINAISPDKHVTYTYLSSTGDGTPSFVKTNHGINLLSQVPSDSYIDKICVWAELTEGEILYSTQTISGLHTVRCYFEFQGYEKYGITDLSRENSFNMERTVFSTQVADGMGYSLLTILPQYWMPGDKTVRLAIRLEQVQNPMSKSRGYVFDDYKTIKIQQMVIHTNKR